MNNIKKLLYEFSIKGEGINHPSQFKLGSKDTFKTRQDVFLFLIKKYSDDPKVLEYVKSVNIKPIHQKGKEYWWFSHTNEAFYHGIKND